jgi:peptidoglycan LD-endopeptidase LytH
VQRTLASLPFPVEGLTARAVQSGFGAERDAGRREHEGIDIFAARNTPALAVVDGTARSGTNPLGGNVVWLRDRGRGLSFYYAHLTRAAFEGTASVSAGDVVGYIGNTGNARTTSPHLHFGIYQRGAIDPLPFLRADDPVPAPIADSGEWASAPVRVTAARSSLRAGTTREAPLVAQLSRGTIAQVAGVTDTHVRVRLPDRSAGYLDQSAVTAARSPLRRQTLGAGEVIRDRPNGSAPVIEAIEEPIGVDVLGEFNGFAFIRAKGGPAGWVQIKTR